MSHQEILEKAIQKAIHGGYDLLDRFESPGFDIIENAVHVDLIVLLRDGDEKEVSGFDYQAIIFNHDFARALWGYGSHCEYCGEPKGNVHPSNCPYALMSPAPALWQYHLQQMVIADDPIQYLGEHL